MSDIDIYLQELNKVKDSVLRYLEGHDSKEELMSICGIVECPDCHGLTFEDELVNHKWDIGGYEEKICKGCRENEE